MTVARGLLKALRLAREAGVQLFRPGASAHLARVPGWGGCGLGPDPAAPTVPSAEALRALELLSVEERTGAHVVRLVATAPVSTPELATTRDTVLDLVRTAKNSLLVLGFGLTDERLHEALIDAAGRGVEILIVGERSRSDLLDFARRWPETVPAADFLQMVEPLAGESSIMHAKVIIADEMRVLIGSANFTSGGMSNNLEVGLRVEGPVAGTLMRLISTLQDRRWLEPLRL